MGSTVRDIDRGARRLEERLAELEGGVRVTVGIHDDAGAVTRSDSGRTVTEVAAGVEFGNEAQAPRSFVRSSFDERRDALPGRLADAGERVLRGDSIESAFAAVGEELADEMRGRAPGTTGQTRDAIAARVTRGA